MRLEAQRLIRPRADCGTFQLLPDDTHPRKCQAGIWWTNRVGAIIGLSQQEHVLLLLDLGFANPSPA